MAKFLRLTVRRKIRINLKIRDRANIRARPQTRLRVRRPRLAPRALAMASQAALLTSRTRIKGTLIKVSKGTKASQPTKASKRPRLVRSP
jgi:hypothetical protein